MKRIPGPVSIATVFLLAMADVSAQDVRTVFPAVAIGDSAVAADEGDCYYYGGRKVPLLRVRPAAKTAAGSARAASPGPGLPDHSRGENASGGSLSGPGEAYLEPESGKRMYVKNRVIVRLQPGADLAPILEKSGARLLERLALPDTYLLQCGAGARPLRTAALIHAEPGVAWAEPEFTGETEPTFIPNDPRFKDQWFLRNTGQFGGKVRADLNVVPAWDITLGRKEVTVAIFDEGVPKGHPDINLSGMSRNFINDPPTGDPWPESTESIHGVSCAGLAGAVGDNKLGVAGVAPNITIMAVKVLDWPIRKFASNKGVADAVLYASMHADIGSISVGVFVSNLVKDAIRQAVRTGRRGKGFLLFKSSGNDNEDQIHTPGEMEEVIAVGASNDKGFRASYSNWGRAGTKTVDFLAPSEGAGGLWTTDLLGPLGTSSGDFTNQFGGTSAATPMAAGVAALILSVNPNLTRAQVLDIMRSTCDKIGGVQYVNGVHAQYGYGQLNAAAALARARGTTTAARPPRSRDGLSGEPPARVSDIRLSSSALTYSVRVRERSRVRMELLHPGGGETRVLLDRVLEPGLAGYAAPLRLRKQGLYLYRVRIGNRTQTGKLLPL